MRFGELSDTEKEKFHKEITKSCDKSSEEIIWPEDEDTETLAKTYLNNKED